VTAATLPAAPGAPGPVPAERPLVEVMDLVKHFPVRGGILQRTVGVVQAVDGVSFDIQRGETLGLVGESGCGKTTVGRLLLRLIEPTSGTITFDGTDLTQVKGAALKPFRRRMQIIFQDPYASLDPRTPIGDSIGEGLRIHGLGTSKERRAKVERIMDMVGLQPYHARRYPHEFSGGQRQRIGIARALVLEPDLVVCDEPVSALDVSIQAQVLNLLKSLQRELGLTYVFVAHNMGVVEHISDRVAVMYLGRIAELADRRDLFRRQEHPYTLALMTAIPVPDPEQRRQRVILTGDVPSPMNPPSGCRFHPRCPLRAQLGDPAICAAETPPLVDLGGGHLAACHFRNPGGGPDPALEPTEPLVAPATPGPAASAPAASAPAPASDTSPPLPSPAAQSAPPLASPAAPDHPA
jgi:oligopeptide transport system ATP-binding protein